ncbi:MAG: hypothetical protein QXN01_00795 [Candidatus Anstonellales archaeon]
MKKMVYAFFILMLSFHLIFSVQMLEPYFRNLRHGDVINIGEMGPGQTIAISVKPEVSVGGKFGQGGVYDQLIITDAPPQWKFKNSKLTSSPLQAEFSAPPDAQEGEYDVKLRILDEENREELGFLDFTAKVVIKKDLLSMDITPTTKQTNAGQPAKFSITLTNKGNANDVFELRSEGFREWKFKKELFLPAKTSKTISYEVVGNEEGNYKVDIIAVSKSSHAVSDKKTVTVLIHTNLLSDYKAINNGVLIFPLFESPVYALAGLISNLVG